MVSGRNKAYTDMPAKDYSTKDTSEFTARVQIEESRPAKIKEGFLAECGVAIPLEELADVIFDIEHDVQTPVFVESFNKNSLKDKQYAIVDIGGQDLVSHVRFVLKWTGSDKNKTFIAYNPHEQTIEKLVYSGQRNKLPTGSGKK
ncbi:hypothetical protein KY346_01285 [Candidatus Woesearchaeota archaeon]|nr:hypothetical protein [Candidatus Woesearchaeota archaeon]